METQKKIEQLQYAQANLSSFVTSRQTFQSQLLEVESASLELKDSLQTYKIVGNIMVSVKKEKLEQDLKEKQEILAIRIQNLEKQEKKLKEKIDSMQSELMEEAK